MLVAGVDSSTQSTKVLLCDAADGTVVGRGSAPHPGGTECDPAAWWAALLQAGAGLLDRAAAVGVAGQQHGMIVLDHDGRVIRPALLWNDLRSAGAAAELVGELGGASWWAQTTGSVPTASFTVTKLRWLAEHEPANAQRVASVLLPHDWLTWRLAGGGPVTYRGIVTGGRTAGAGPLTGGGLVAGGGPMAGGGPVAGGGLVAGGGPVAGGGLVAGGGPVTDRGDASGTGYFSPVTGEWLPDVAAAALGHRVQLPRVASPGEAVGTAPPGGPVLSAGTVISAGTGDNMAAALGLGLGAGDVVISIGTSGTAFAVSEGPAADPSGAVAGFADATGRFLPLVCTVNAALVLDAAAAMLGTDNEGLSGLALTAEPGAGGLTLLPYLDGERTPDRPGATGVLRGLTTRNATRQNLARAAVEAVLASLADAAGLLAASGIEQRRVLLIGGGARSEAVCRIAPGIFGAPVLVPEPEEYVALGAARQAAWALAGTSQPPAWPRRPASAYSGPPEPQVRERHAALREDTAGWS